MAENLIFETHAHYDDEAFSEDRYKLLEGMKSWGIGTVMNIGASIESSRTSLELAEKYPFVYAAVGVHPEYADRMNEEILAELETLAQNKKVVAIGEIGLDYHYPEPDPEVQRIWFRRQMELAVRRDLPVVIHSREAAADTLNILKEFSGWKREFKGSMHCYSYSAEIAKEVIKMGYHIGIGGVITFNNARKLVEALEVIPMDRVLLETDCPYMAPTPHRGERNFSGYLPLVAKKIAELKGITEEEVIHITRENAEAVFGPFGGNA